VMIATQRMNFLVCSLTSPPPQRSTVSVCSIGIDTPTPIDGDLYTSLQSGDLGPSTDSNSDPQPQPGPRPNDINHQVADHPRVANLNNTALLTQSLNPDPSTFPTNHPDNTPGEAGGKGKRKVAKLSNTSLPEGDSRVGGVESPRRNFLVPKVEGQPYQRRPVDTFVRPLRSVDEGQVFGSGGGARTRPSPNVRRKGERTRAELTGITTRTDKPS